MIGKYQFKGGKGGYVKGKSSPAVGNSKSPAKAKHGKKQVVNKNRHSDKVTKQVKAALAAPAPVVPQLQIREPNLANSQVK